MLEPCRPESVVDVFVPLWPQCGPFKDCHLARLEACDTCIAPEAMRREGGRHQQRVVPPSPYGRHASGDCIFRMGAIGVECGAITKAACPLIRLRVDLRPRLVLTVVVDPGVRFLVADERPVRRLCLIDAGLEARLPEHCAAAEESEIDSGVAGSLHAAALRSGPIGIEA